MAISDFDETDLTLIDLLQANGRASLTELGAKLGVSHGTIRNRLDRLLAQQVIKITAVVDPAVVGRSMHVLIGVSADLDQLEAVERQLAELDEIYFLTNVTGRLDFICGVALSPEVDLRSFLTQKLANVKGIQRTETFHVLHFAKRAWEWAISPRSLGETGVNDGRSSLPAYGRPSDSG